MIEIHVGTQHVLEQVTNIPSAYSMLRITSRRPPPLRDRNPEDQFGETTKTTSTCGQVLDAILHVPVADLPGSRLVLDHEPAALDGDTPLVHNFVDLDHLVNRAKMRSGRPPTRLRVRPRRDGYDALRASRRDTSSRSAGRLRPQERRREILLAGNFTHTPMRPGSDPELLHDHVTRPRRLTPPSSRRRGRPGGDFYVVGDVVVSLVGTSEPWTKA